MTWYEEMPQSGLLRCVGDRDYHPFRRNKLKGSTQYWLRATERQLLEG